MKISAALLATLSLVLLVGCSAGKVTSPLPNVGATTQPPPACDQYVKMIPESALFSYGSNNLPVEIAAMPGYSFTWVSIHNLLVMSPALVSAGPPTFVPPRSLKAWSVTPPVPTFTVQQTFDNYDNGAGVQVIATECDST